MLFLGELVVFSHRGLVVDDRRTGGVISSTLSGDLKARLSRQQVFVQSSSCAQVEAGQRRESRVAEGGVGRLRLRQCLFKIKSGL